MFSDELKLKLHAACFAVVVGKHGDAVARRSGVGCRVHLGECASFNQKRILQTLWRCRKLTQRTQ